MEKFHIKFAIYNGNIVASHESSILSDFTVDIQIMVNIGTFKKCIKHSTL